MTIPPSGRATHTPRANAWQQFMRLSRGSSRRLLSSVTASSDSDPVPFVIWVTALVLTPLLLTAIRSFLRLSMTSAAGSQAILDYVAYFRVFYIFYAMLVALLATAAIWDALLPDRADQDIMGVLPVRPMVLAAARLAGATRVVLLLALAVALPVALTFGAASGLQQGSGAVLRVVPAHLLTTTAAIISVYFTLVTIRAAIVLVGSDRVAERLASILQAVTLLVFVEAFVFLPGVMQTIVHVLHDAVPPPFWFRPLLWFAALYGWIAEGGARSRDVTLALTATFLPAATGIVLSLAPAAWLGRRAQASLPHHRASLVTQIARVLVAIRRPDSPVAGMVVFAAATLARSRRHALLLATATGMAIAIATIELLTAGFMDRFNMSAPRQDVLAVPLVAIFFVIFGLRGALAQPADAQANWIFRIASPSITDGRRAARLIVMWFGLLPVLMVEGLVLPSLWGFGTASEVLALDCAAAFLLNELAFARWRTIPCASAFVAATDAVRSRWPLLVLCLYLFAFRGADLQMFALRHDAMVWVIVAGAAGIGVTIRLYERAATRTAMPAIDVMPDGLSALHLSELDA
jgi:hypothetical protein